MNNSFKKLLAAVFAVLILFGTVAVGGEGFAELLETVSIKASAAYSVGDTIYYGTYPQSEVTDTATIAGLTVSGVAGSATGDGWKSYGYYSGTGSLWDGQMTASDYMRYKDVTYKGEKYRGVIFDTYRPHCTGYTSSASNSFQDDNGYTTGTTYWFKYEPLEWRVLDPSTGFVMCETIIDSQPYNNYILDADSKYWGNSSQTYYASDYANSSIREWLNDDFYNTAFSDEQKLNIKITTLNNDGYRTLTGATGYEDYDSASTNDKIFLLSYDEVLNSSYGFSTGSDSARRPKGSDYAKCQGLHENNSSSSSYYGCSGWRLRSPGSSSYIVCGVYYGGEVYSDYFCHTYITRYCVRPALKLQNLKSDYAGSETDDSDLKNTVFTKNINNDPNGEETKMTFPYSLEHYIYLTPSTEYNPSLASILSWFAYSAYLDEGTFVWNKSERTHIEKTYMSFGFDELQSYRYNISAMESKDCAYSIAKKNLDNGKTLVMITVRGTGNDFSEGIRGEWLGDLTVCNWGTASGFGWHPNFEKCAHDVFDSLKDKNWLDTSGNTLYCLTGHSKGAAVANLTSVLLEQNGVAKESVYDYNFACPDVAVDSHLNWNLFGNHDNMFNINNVCDFVPYVPAIIGNHLITTGAANPLSTWGKYGISKWFSLNWQDISCTNVAAFVTGSPCKYVNEAWNTKIIEDTVNPHDPRIYLTFCRNELGLSDMLDRETAEIISGEKLTERGVQSLTDLNPNIGLRKILETVVLTIRCPVDFEIKDSKGNILAKCVDNTPVYYKTENNFILIFVDGDRKAVLISNPLDVLVNIIATDIGTMSFEGDQLYNFFKKQDDDKKVVDNIALTKGKRFQYTVNDIEVMKNNSLYVLDNSGKTTATVNADGSETPVIDATLKLPSNTEVEYASTVTVKAKATGVPEGYYVALYDGNNQLERGSNTEVSYTFPGEFKSSKNITVKVIDNDGNVQKDSNGNDLTASFEVKAKSGFFAKIIAFFKSLFGMLPKVEIKP